MYRLHRVDDRRRRCHVSQPHAGCDYLGEGAAVEHGPFLVQGLDGGGVFSGEAQVRVAVVLEDREAVTLGNVEHVLSSSQAHVGAGGVLESGDGVQKLRPLTPVSQAGEDVVQCAGDDSLFVHVHAHETGAVASHDAHRAGVAELLREYDVTGVREKLHVSRYGLAGAGGEQNLVGRHVHTPLALQLLGDELPHGGVSLGMGVIDQVLTFILQCAAQGLQEAVGGERVRVRKRRGEVESDAPPAWCGLGRRRNPPGDAVRKVEGVGRHEPSRKVLKQRRKYITTPTQGLAELPSPSTTNPFFYPWVQVV